MHACMLTYTVQKGLASAPHCRQAKGARPRGREGRLGRRGRSGMIRPWYCGDEDDGWMGGWKVDSFRPLLAGHAYSTDGRRFGWLTPLWSATPFYTSPTYYTTDLRERVRPWVLRHVHPPLAHRLDTSDAVHTCMCGKGRMLQSNSSSA